MDHNALIIIPARYGATRFPGKPLAMIAGRTLIQRVYERAAASREAAGVFVATDDARIFEHVEGFGGRVVMTPSELASGTDRIAHALGAIEESEGRQATEVVNLQGDEPLADMEAVDRMIDVLRWSGADIATLASPLASPADFENPDVVKVVCDLAGNALYFSRSPLPWGGTQVARRHVGVYGYRRDSLLSFSALPPSPLEAIERLEQLRALQNGLTIRVLETTAPHLGVDRPEDVAKIERELAKLH